MADITMCTGTGCPKAMWCYRHTATPSPYRQSMFVVPPGRLVRIDGDEVFLCEHFWSDDRWTRTS